MVENGIALMNRYGAYGSVQVKRDEIRGLHGCKLTPLYSLIPPLYGPDVGASAQPQAEGSSVEVELTAALLVCDCGIVRLRGALGRLLQPRPPRDGE